MRTSQGHATWEGGGKATVLASAPLRPVGRMIEAPMGKEEKRGKCSRLTLIEEKEVVTRHSYALHVTLSPVADQSPPSFLFSMYAFLSHTRVIWRGVRRIDKDPSAGSLLSVVN